MSTKTKKLLALIYGVLCLTLLVVNAIYAFKNGWDIFASLRIISNLCFIILAIYFYKRIDAKQ